MKLSAGRLIIGLCSIAIVAIVVIFFYRGGTNDNASGSSVKYKEFAVERGTFQVIVSAAGVVKPIDRVEIKSKASGLIKDLPVEEGDYVSKGALIARLDQTDVQAELDQAHADLDIAEAELKQAQNTHHRREQLFIKGLISEEDKDQADLLLAQAKGRMVRAKTTLNQAEVRFSETIVCAPINGIILQKYVEEGQIIASGISNVSGGTPIADIADMSSVYIEAGIDEIDVGKVRIDLLAGVIAEAYPRLEFSGKIIRIAPEAKVEQNVTLFDVIIEVENNDSKLKSGMNATVEISIVRQENVLLVPSMTLRKSKGPKAGKNFRQVLLKQDEEYIPHRVKIGLSDFRQTIIISGLEEGDILGVPMTSRLKAENDKIEQRIKNSRSFGSGDPKPGKK